MAKRTRAGATSGSFLRLPIAVKFTAFITLLVIAFMLWQRATAIRVAQDRLDREINESGVVLATAVSALLDAERVLSDDSESLVEVLGRFTRSPGPVREQVLNIVVYNSGGEALATARDDVELKLSAPRPIDDAAAQRAGVRIQELSINGRAARSFVRDVTATKDDDTDTVGRVELYLSATEIEESNQALAQAMVTVSTTAFIVAALSCFLLARFLTRHVRALLKDIRQVSQGDLQHQSLVRSSDELGDLARAFNIMTTNLHTAQEAKLEQKALEQELSIATEIQTRLLPSAKPSIPGFEVGSYYLSAMEVGGDYYDFIQVDKNHVGVVVADVSGKSVPGSLIMTMTRSLLRLAAAGGTHPAKAMQTVNRFLAPDVTPGMFVTLVYCVIDVRSGEVNLVRCGHNAPFLMVGQREQVLRLQPGGIALCLDRDGHLFDRELKTQRFTMAPGDTLVLYTDGVTEAKARDGSDYTEDRLAKVVAARRRSPANGLLEEILKDVARHRGKTPQSDDITLIVLRRT